MIPYKLESTYSNSAKSECMSETEDSVSDQPENIRRSEPKKKMKKVRSIRLLRLSSMRSSSRGAKSLYDNLSVLSSADTESSGRPTPIEMSDSSPNYMKATSSSHAKGSFQGSQRTLTRKSLTRMSTLKLKRSLTRKLSGGSELRRKLKPSRSIKVASVNGLRPTRQVKCQYKASPLNSESIYCSNGQNRNSPSDMQMYSSCDGNKSRRVITRRLSLKPVRLLTKMSTFKSRRSSMEKNSQISASPDSSLHKATCSSTLKDSHFPDHIDLPQEGSESQGVPAVKICPYTYCSLHGHRHRDNVPPLKRFVSMRRRQLKTQKSMKMESRPLARSKHSGNTKKGTQKSQTVHCEDPASKTVHSGGSSFQKVKKEAREPVRTRSIQASTLSGGGTYGGEERNYNLKYNAEVLLGETSFPHKSFEEFLSKSLAVKGHILSSFLAIKETNMECCCIPTENDKPEPRAIETEGYKKIIAAHKKNDSGVATSNEELGVEVSQEVKEEGNSILKPTNPESSGRNSHVYELTSASGQLSDESKRPNQNGLVDSTSTNVVTSSASDIETLEEELQTKDKNMEPKYEVLQVSSPHREPEHACTTDTTYAMQDRNHKYINMWRLIYRHAVLTNTGEGEEALHFDGQHKEGQGQDALSFNGVNSSPSCQDYCETDQDMDDENRSVVELVQKAFDEILLPETEDVSSNDHLKSRGIASYQEPLEKSQDKRGEGNTSTSRESPKEEAHLEVDNFGSHGEEETAQRMVEKPEQKTPKSWSNLKKLILLKRFVKALEKARKLNQYENRHLPPDANIEAEKVHLRHQMAEEKKNAEEWMLDYALQKVISKLAPAQRRKVALLIEAFETLLPFQNTQNSDSSATVDTQAKLVQALTDFSDHSKEDRGKDRAQLLGEVSCSHNNFIKECADSASDNPMPKQYSSIALRESSLDYSGTETVKNICASRAVDEDQNGKQSLASSYDKVENSSIADDNTCLTEIKDSGSWSFSEPDDIISTCHEEASTNEIVSEVPQDLVLHSNTEIPNIKSELDGKDFETKNLVSANGDKLSMSRSLFLKGLVKSLGSNLISSAAPSDLLDEPTSDRKERIEKGKPENVTLEGLPMAEEAEPPESADVKHETQLEKQNFTRLWYLVYKHMASGIAVNDSKPHVTGSEEKESWNDDSRIEETNASISYESRTVQNQEMHLKYHGVSDPETELHQLEAIKMVEAAIDAILPNVQDHAPDDQSLTDNIISENSKESDRTERVYSESLDKKEMVTSGNGVIQEQEEEAALKEGNKPNQQLSRKWSNLKKVILLKRFIKALEKVRKFNPRGPRYLPVEPDPEAEKVHLRHQDMEDRKGAEEWMLDYALQEVVNKLTPARKRKVQLLVEAFETVMPTIKN